MKIINTQKEFDALINNNNKFVIDEIGDSNGNYAGDPFGGLTFNCNIVTTANIDCYNLICNGDLTCRNLKCENLTCRDLKCNNIQGRDLICRDLKCLYINCHNLNCKNLKCKSLDCVYLIFDKFCIARKYVYCSYYRHTSDNPVINGEFTGKFHPNFLAISNN